MMSPKEEASCSASHSQAIDLTSAVKELQKLSSQDLNKLLRDSENFTVQCLTAKGSSTKVDMEKFVGFLPLHLLAVLLSAQRDESMFRYFLSGLRLLHSLCDLAPRNSKLEQILLDDVKVSEQLIDLVFYTLTVLAGSNQEKQDTSAMPLLHAALVACSLYLLTVFISSHWQDLVHVLLAHPKIDVFMDVAFRAVCIVGRSLQIKLSGQQADFCSKVNLTIEQLVNYLCYQCEASLQFLHSLCQHKTFRERLLRNKELCGKGGVLLLAQTILKLEATPPFSGFSTVVASLSRLKAKILSILLHLCETESISYLDEVALSPGSCDLAKSVVLEVITILKTTLSRNHGHSHSDRNVPLGLLQLNAMRLADVISDDSNFRSYITAYFTEVLTAIFSIPHGEFLSSWCSSNPPVREEDATLEYDSYGVAGWILDVNSSSDITNVGKWEFSFAHSNMPLTSYAHQRTSFFVKIIANLHCFVPSICQEQERNLFLHKFMESLQGGLSEGVPGISYLANGERATTVCKNFRSLLSHAESLIPTSLNEEDVQLLRVFFNQLQASLSEKNGVQEDQSTTGSYSQQKSENKRKDGPLNNSACGDIMDELYAEAKQIDRSDNLSRQYKEEDEEEEGEEGKTGESGFGVVSRDPDRDVMNIETSGSDTSSVKGKNSADRMENNGDSSIRCKQNKDIKLGPQVDEKTEVVQSEEKQRRKRKRTIMNDEQISLIENALLDEPEMQRKAASIQSWADKLSDYGSEITCSQLKNWLNNRKARLARAAKDTRAPPEVDNTQPNTPESPGIEAQPPAPTSASAPAPAPSSSTSGAHKTSLTDTKPKTQKPLRLRPGHRVSLVDSKTNEIGKGTVVMASGEWFGRNLDESDTYVVDIDSSTLKLEKWQTLPYPSEATGNNFQEAEWRHSAMRVLWDSNKTLLYRDSFPRYRSGDRVILMDQHGAEIGEGRVFMSIGEWYGKNLVETETYVVDIVVSTLKVKRWQRVLHPSKEMGNTFEEALRKFSSMRVLWDFDKLLQGPDPYWAKSHPPLS